MCCLLRQAPSPKHSIVRISHVYGLSSINLYLAVLLVAPAASVNPVAFGAFADAPTVLAVASTPFAPTVSVAHAVNPVLSAAFAVVPTA